MRTFGTAVVPLGPDADTESGAVDALTSASTVARLVVVGTPSAARGSALAVADLAGRLRCPLLTVAQDGPRRG